MNDDGGAYHPLPLLLLLLEVSTADGKGGNGLLFMNSSNHLLGSGSDP